jgi:hypothetical protein
METDESDEHLQKADGPTHESLQPDSNRTVERAAQAEKA